MSDPVFSADEVNAALKLAGIDYAVQTQLWPVGELAAWWNDSFASCQVAALSLGVLPEGWAQSSLIGTAHGAGKDATGYGHKAGKVFVIAPCGLSPMYGQVKAADWPEAVRSGQAEIACRLLAAHIELERLRAGGAA